MDKIDTNRAPPMIDFADMDRDGMVDMVFYEPNQQAIKTLYNKLHANGVSEVNLCKAAQSSMKRYVGEANRFFAPFGS